MPALVYNPDHTAHIRAWLRPLATRGAAGLVITALAGGVVAVVASGAPEALSDGLVRAVWIALSILATLSALSLLLATVLWTLYRIRRADLNAQGAEADGERKARIANQR